MPIPPLSHQNPVSASSYVTYTIRSAPNPFRLSDDRPKKWTLNCSEFEDTSPARDPYVS